MLLPVRSEGAELPVSEGAAAPLVSSKPGAVDVGPLEVVCVLERVGELMVALRDMLVPVPALIEPEEVMVELPVATPVGAEVVEL